MVTWENYEEHMMMHADGGLSPAEERELAVFLDAHPELKKEMAAWEMTKLVVDTSVVYNAKDSLLRKEAGARVIAFPHWQRYSIAAGIAAIIFISFFKLNHTEKDVAVAKIDTVKNTVIVPGNNIKSSSQNNVEVASKDTVVKVPVSVNNCGVAVVPHAKNPIAKKGYISQPDFVRQIHESKKELPIASVNDNKEPISKLNPSAIREFAVNSISSPASLAVNVPGVIAKADNMEQDNSEFDYAHDDGIRKQSIEKVSDAIAIGFEKLNSLKHTIADNGVSVTIERRRLIVSF